MGIKRKCVLFLVVCSLFLVEIVLYFRPNAFLSLTKPVDGIYPLFSFNGWISSFVCFFLDSSELRFLVNRASRILRIHRCHPLAISYVLLARCSNIPAELVIGQDKTQSPMFHAWVQVDGKAVYGLEEDVSFERFK